MEGQRRKLNLLAITELEKVDEDIAIQVVSSPDLDKKELSQLIQDSITDHYLLDNQPVRMKNSTTMAGMRNLIDLIEKDIVNGTIR